MNREELNKLAKEELIEECIDLQDDNAWWERRWEAEHRIAFEEFKPRIDKAIEYIEENSYLVQDKEINGVPLMSLRLDKCYDLLEILGDKE